MTFPIFYSGVFWQRQTTIQELPQYQVVRRFRHHRRIRRIRRRNCLRFHQYCRAIRHCRFRLTLGRFGNYFG